ncbi:MAG: type II toxin-antitoxin system prevent-host-death family antitoxin [Candidatus Berkelbacteria bacterium]|nr:type II toxin-antitoxin system prevent-host-death family antitoxin [Candidatus Berkelbacteria bacterium]
MKIEEDFVTVSELQASISNIIRNVEAGKKYVIMRYSKPSSVLLGFQEYKELKKMAKFAKGGACRVCEL